MAQHSKSHPGIEKGLSGGKALLPVFALFAFSLLPLVMDDGAETHGKPKDGTGFSLSASINNSAVHRR